MSLFLKSSTLSLQPGVLLSEGAFNTQHVEDSFRRPAEYEQTTDIFWPRGRGMGGVSGEGSLPSAGWFSWPRMDSGARSCLIIAGVTRDLNGAILANCSVECITVAGDIRQSTVLSGNDGTFACPTYVAGNHYLVAYKASSPANLAGSTDQNLTGA
jgi:hypothetical protein